MTSKQLKDLENKVNSYLKKNKDEAFGSEDCYYYYSVKDKCVMCRWAGGTESLDVSFEGVGMYFCEDADLSDLQDQIEHIYEQVVSYGIDTYTFRHYHNEN